ncbi:hypothetical protein SDC9_49954 [bioreactor metagenome]|uniref:Flagellar assembly protein FliH/Type III secretion system HrpE domain-containing protein n=1 Tax=bioreactor metagenome TaxID=1076179 RepID=A0A644WJD5_9ZZZZ
MSSFRIDRQYVSFVTAETKAVIPYTEAYLSNSEIAAKEECAEEINRRCAEILEKTRKDAEGEAEVILKKARTEADGLIIKAKQTADEMTEEAKNSVAAIREEAKRTGYSEGEKKAFTHAEARKTEEAKEYTQLVSKLNQDYADLVDGMRKDIISLVMDIVKKVIEFRVNESDETFLLLLNNSLDQLKHNGTVVIHVGSEDYERYFSKGQVEKSIHTGKAKLIVTEEEDYSPGDLVVESEGEMLDFSIGRQIERIEKALMREGD